MATTKIVTRATDPIAENSAENLNKGSALTHAELDKNFYPITSVTHGTAANGKAMIPDSNVDIGGMRNITCTGTVTATGNIFGASSSIPIMLSAESVGTDTSITQALSGTVERIEVAFYGLSCNGANNLVLRLGTGAALVSTGYVSVAADRNQQIADVTSGFLLNSQNAAAADNLSGIVTLVHCLNDQWTINGAIYLNDANNPERATTIAGKVDVGGAVDIVGLAPESGNLSAGHWKVSYQRSA